MKRAPHMILLGAVLLVAFALTGCQTMEDKTKAEPSKGAGFVPVEAMQQQADLPFNKVWVKAGIDWAAYKTLYIKEVNTQYLMQANWWQKSFRKDDYEADVKTVAQYMRDKFIKAFQEDPNRRYQVVPSPAPGSITLELALTELVPSDPLLEAIALAAPDGSGVAVEAMARKTGAVGTVAFEARVVDSGTSTVIAMAADREEEKVAPLNLRAFTWYGVAHRIIDDWAMQFVEVANKRPGQIIKATSSFTLMPW